MNRTIIFTLAVSMCGLLAPHDAEAGCLLDWFRGRRAAMSGCNTCGTTPTSGYVSTQANPMGLQPGQCARTCMQTCSRTVVNYVPETCYRTDWQRVPVTQYRPVTNSDPCTGCTVTCMRPCTTYTWQAKRVPYTTYRPVYRTETYKVPVTTISNECATGTCPTGTCGTNIASPAGCSTCGVPTGMAYSQPSAATGTDPNGVYYTTPSGAPLPGGSSMGVPADVQPSLEVRPQSTQRPSVLDQMQDTSTSYPIGTGVRSPAPILPPPPAQVPTNSNWLTRQAPASAPAVATVSPIRERWSYTPVRQASYTAPVNPEPAASEIHGQFETRRDVQPTAPSSRNANAGWQTVSW